MKKYFQLDPIDSRINFSVLDCLRGLAATYVVFSHARPNLYAGGAYLEKIKPRSSWTLFEKLYISFCQCTKLGYEFVIFFFILSGFSIAFSIHHSKAIGSFYKRRLIRIYPPYLLGIFWAMLIMFLIQLIIPLWTFCNVNNYTSQSLCNAIKILEFKNIIKNFLYFPNGVILSQYWSLPHEIMFYAFIPLFIRSVKWYIIISALIYFAYLPFKGIVYNEAPYKSIDFVLHYNFYFALGVYLYYYKSFITEKIWLPKYKLLFIIIFFGIFLLMTVLKAIFGEYNFITQLLAVILSFISIKYFLNTNYNPRILAFLGKFSYTIYVMHFATIFLLKLLLHIFFNFDGLPITNKYLWIIGGVLSIICCYGFYFLAEKPSKEYLKRLR